jgi:hypothetical protein
MVTIVKEGASASVIKKILSRLKKNYGFSSKKHSGVIKLKEDPMEIQKKMRDEWS